MTVLSVSAAGAAYGVALGAAVAFVVTWLVRTVLAERAASPEPGLVVASRGAVRVLDVLLWIMGLVTALAAAGRMLLVLHPPR